MITSATKRIRSYDFQTGKLLWECTGLTENAIPTPVSANGLVYCTSGFRGSALLAIRYADAQGDITGTPAIAWTYDGKGTPYVPSPLLLGNELYFLQENRAAPSCVDAKSGRAHYALERLEGLGDVFSSPVGASERVYVVARDGKMAVIQAGPEFKILATNSLDDSFSASPAIVGQEIYLAGTSICTALRALAGRAPHDLSAGPRGPIASPPARRTGFNDGSLTAPSGRRVIAGTSSHTGPVRF